MNYALILAGGTGSRAGGPLPKQFQEVGGKRMLWWSIEAFKAFDPDCRIVLAVHPDFIDSWDELFGEEERAAGIELIKVRGGNSRIESVRNALRAVTRPDAKVFIHDAARPFVSTDLIRRGLDAVAKGIGAVPAVPVTDSMRRLTPGGSEGVVRSDYVAVQTPQVFICSDIKKAYEALEDEAGLTDDASVAERHGIRIVLFEGDPANRKVTNPSDFRV